MVKPSLWREVRFWYRLLWLTPDSRALAFRFYRNEWRSQRREVRALIRRRKALREARLLFKTLVEYGIDQPSIQGKVN